jgi:hypothetical protein
MLANKLIQKLIIINGLLLPLIPILLLFSFFKSEFFDRRPEDTPYVEGDGVIVGDKLEKAKAEKLGLQGIYMPNNAPEEVFNSKNFYVKLYLNTYEQAKQFEDLANSAGDINPYSFLNACNVMFLGENYAFKSLLLNKKANI